MKEMRMREIALLGLCVFCCLPILAAEDALPSIQDLQRWYAEANGGLSNIQTLSSLIASGQAIQADGQSYDFKLYRKRPNLMRTQINFGNIQIVTVFDGLEVFRVLSADGVPDRVFELEGEEAAQTEALSHMDGPFFKLRGRSEFLEVLFEVDVNGEAAFEIAIGEQANSPYERIWISKENYQEIKLSRMIKTEAGDGALEEIYLSDFVQTRGVWLAKNIRHEQAGELTKQIVIDRVKANVGIFDSFFVKPKS
jgi:hypothetical protein